MNNLKSIIVSVIVAAIIGLGGWTYAQDRKVAALEARGDAILLMLQEIRADVREIREHLLRQGRP